MNDAWLRFDAATNPYGPSPQVREAMAAFAARVTLVATTMRSAPSRCAGIWRRIGGFRRITSSCTTDLGKPWSGFFWRGCY